MIIVWGAIEAKPEYLDEVLRIGLLHVQRSRKESGCLKHSIHTDAEHPNRVVFYEEWQDQDALRQHFRVPASNDFVSAAAKLAVRAPEIKMYEATEVR